MKKRLSICTLLLLGFVLLLAAGSSKAQGNSGSIEGVVKDPSGAGIGNAKVEISYVVSGLHREVTTAPDGSFKFTNVPFNTYHTVVTASGFTTATQDIDVRSGVPVKVEINLKIGTEVTTVTVTEKGADLIETESTFHTDVDRELFEKLPLESASSSLSSLVTLSTPGVAADSNGLFHGLGDHAENSFSVDNQPITDQQSKVFSNQLPSDSIQSMEVISGAPPAEFGGKTSLVIKVTTRSGLGLNKPTGSVTTSYGSFGTSNIAFDFAYGGSKWGNFIAVNGLNTGRFLDPPEFAVMHDKGNQQNVFDRIDLQVSGADTIHLNLGYSRSWFQTPNSFDQQFHPCDAGGLAALGYDCNASGTSLLNPVTGLPLGPADERSKIGTFNIAPTWTHLFSTATLITFGGFARHDQYNYYPSGNPLNDLAPDLQAESAKQNRKLTNLGTRADLSYVKGMHNLKAGATFEHTLLTENDSFAIVDPTFNVPGSTTFNPILACLDLTRPAPNPADGCTNTASTPFLFNGHTDVKEVALYVQDTISKGGWSFNLGMRGDLYRGITHATQAEPRMGIAYNIKPSSTVLRVSYARTLESPFNENLVIASTGCSIPVLAAIVPPPGIPCTAGPITPAFRNEFHAGLEQAFGKYMVVSGEYIWKYTHNGYDFGVVGATPITFPIEWQRNKIPGYAFRLSVPNYHGFSALVVMSGVSARFFLPQVAGLPIIGPGTSVFRIDHDEVFNQTTHLQYQPWKRGPWLGFNWRYDSGLVSGAVPCLAATATCAASTSTADGGANPNIGTGQVALVNAVLALPLTADQEYQAGLTCNGQLAAPNPLGAALATCPASHLSSIYVKVPGPGKENDDHNPQRIQPRNLFDASVGEDDLFHGDHYKWSLRFTAVNLMNKTALYNFLSTFSGTHYVTPRSLTAELGFHF